MATAGRSDGLRSPRAAFAAGCHLGWLFLQLLPLVSNKHMISLSQSSCSAWASGQKQDGENWKSYVQMMPEVVKEMSSCSALASGLG